MMRQVELRQGERALRGWIEDRGTNGVPVSLGASVEIKDEGRWTVSDLHTFSMPSREVKSMQDRARTPFTALKSFRGNK